MASSWPYERYNRKCNHCMVLFLLFFVLFPQIEKIYLHNNLMNRILFLSNLRHKMLLLKIVQPY